MKISRVAGTTSEILQVFIRDSSSTTGAGLTGLTNASSGLTAYYIRNNQATATSISVVTMTLGTYTSGGFKEIDSTNMPGWYQFCPPDALFTSGRSAAMHLKGVTNMAPLPVEVEITATNNQTALSSQTIGTATSVTNGVTVTTNNDKTGYTVSTNQDKTGYELDATGSAALTEGYRTSGSTGTIAQLLYEILAHLGEASISGTTKTLKKLDHATTAETFTLDSSSAPTSITRAT